MDYEARNETYYTCPCGWSREYTDTAEWKQTEIDHPLWGRVTNYSAAYLDVQAHNCIETRFALKRSPRARAEVIYDYEAAQARAKVERAYQGVRRTRAESSKSQQSLERERSGASHAPTGEHVGEKIEEDYWRQQRYDDMMFDEHTNGHPQSDRDKCWMCNDGLLQ